MWKRLLTCQCGSVREGAPELMGVEGGGKGRGLNEKRLLSCQWSIWCAGMTARIELPREQSVMEYPPYQIRQDTERIRNQVLGLL